MANIQLSGTDVQTLRTFLLKKQNGLCAIRGLPIKSAVLDHQHEKGLKGTGNIRGVIDRDINIFLGKLENNCKRFNISLEDLPTVLRQLADYIDKGDYINEDGHTFRHPSEKPKEKTVSKSNYNRLKKQYTLSNAKKKFPEYPKSCKLTKELEKLFNEFKIEPYN